MGFFFFQHCQSSAKAPCQASPLAASLAKKVNGGDGVAIHGFHDKHSVTRVVLAKTLSASVDDGDSRRAADHVDNHQQDGGRWPS